MNDSPKETYDEYLNRLHRDARKARPKETKCPQCGYRDVWGCGNPDCPYPPSETGAPIW